MAMLTVVMPLMKTNVVSISSITRTWLFDGDADCCVASDENNCSKY